MILGHGHRGIVGRIMKGTTMHICILNKEADGLRFQNKIFFIKLFPIISLWKLMILRVLPIFYPRSMVGRSYVGHH